jgi:hypothetical protein
MIVYTVAEFERPIGLPFIELVDYLENLLGRKADILTPTGCPGYSPENYRQEHR